MIQDARLVHVATVESSARRLLPKVLTSEELTQEPSGSFELQPWDDEHIAAILRAQMSGDSHVVQVTIMALYRLASPTPADVDRKEADDFYNEHIVEMMPFLRSAVYSASSTVWPVNPIMLDPLESVSRNSP